MSTTARARLVDGESVDGVGGRPCQSGRMAFAIIASASISSASSELSVKIFSRPISVSTGTASGVTRSLLFVPAQRVAANGRRRNLDASALTVGVFRGAK